MSHVTPVLLIVLSFLAARIDNAAAASSANNASRCSVSCELGSNVQFHGFDPNKNLLTIDEKKCVKVYVNPSETTSCVPDEDTCQRECSPRSYWLETHINREGPFMLKAIKKCYATTHHCQDCQRKPNRIYVFPGSKYQKGIDVGKCSGVCDEEGVGGSGEEAEGTSDSSATPEMTCLATRTRQVAVEGPNGYMIMDVIENCSCVSHLCYRADHFQSVSVMVDNKRRDELVNIGKCLGSCPGVFIGGRCVQYEEGLCTWYLPGSPALCRPTADSTFLYTDIGGTNKTLPVIDECGCTTG